MQRRIIHFRGQVQGVGFRFHVRSIAAPLPVKGFVRNLSDGRVELVVEAEPAVIDALVARVREQMSGYIDDADERIEPPTGEFTAFEIRR